MSIFSSLATWLTGKNIPTIRFKSYIGDFSHAAPVKRIAIQESRKTFSTWMKEQFSQKGKKKSRYTSCPGMLDYSQMGFIVVAHTDIHIKANSAGVVVRLGALPPMPPHEAGLLSPKMFEYALVKGMAPIQPGLATAANKIPLPWAVFTKPGWSAMVLPALMHSDFLDKIFIYPGVVDYDKFYTINFVFSAIKECEFTIWAGTPILQVIPFERKPVTGVCSKATPEEKDLMQYSYLTQRPGAYRRLFHSKKSSVLTDTKSPSECPFHAENDK